MLRAGLASIGIALPGKYERAVVRNNRGNSTVANRVEQGPNAHYFWNAWLPR